MWSLKRVGSPAISPDGRYVVFSVTEPSYAEKDQVNDLWIVPTDKSEKPRKLTSAKGGESGYSWSPDGKFLAFVAKRDGEEESQIYLLNMKAGGEAQKLTSLSSGAGGPKWRSDSKVLLFTSNVYPGCFADSLQKKEVEKRKNQKYKARVYDSFPIRDWDKWLDEKQSHLYFQHIDSTSATNLFSNVSMVNLSGFQLGSAVWAGTDEVVFSAAINKNTAAYENTISKLYKVGINGGEAQLLTDDSTNYSSPQISANGKYLYCLSYTPAYTIYDLSKLTRIDWPSLKNKVTLSASLDRPVNNFTLSNSEVYASVEDKGRDIIYKWTENKLLPVKYSTIDKGCYLSPAAASGMVVSSYETASMPAEIALIHYDGKHEQLTHFNDAKLATLDLNEVETFYTTTDKGKSIRSMLVKPAKFEATKKYPLFVLMHGGPAISYKEAFTFRWNYHLLAGEEYVLVLTDYTGSTGYGEKFARDIQYDPFRGPAHEINEAAADAIRRFSFIDGDRQAAGGASYGGHLANWMQATTDHYKCLIAHAGAVNFVTQWGSSDVIYGREIMNGGAPWTRTKTWLEQNPYNYAANFKTPMLLTVGELDYRVPLNNTIENWHIHQRLKVPSRLVVFPEENHWILKGENSRFHYQEIKSWLAKWL